MAARAFLWTTVLEVDSVARRVVFTPSRWFGALFAPAFAVTPVALLWIEHQYAMQYLNLMLQSVAETQARNALSLISSFDPTGITSVASAFWQPQCDLQQPYPTVRVLY